MRIGIDLDDTICNTKELVSKLGQEYAHENNIDYEEVFNNNEYREDFFTKYTIDIFSKAEIKPYVKEVLKRLKKNHELYIITARSNDFISTGIDVLRPTNKWLNTNDIEVDKIIINSYGPAKAKACLDNKIDLLIDDELYNIEEVNKVGIKCLLFDDKNRYNLKNTVTNWLDIEKIIEGDVL